MAKKSINGFMAWVGVWVALCAVGELALKIESVAYLMLWGVASYIVANRAGRWINGELKQAAEV